MDTYKVVEGVLHIGEGVRIGLSKDQAAARAGKLQETGEEGVFIARTGLQFKKGEIVGLAAVARAQSQQLEPFETPAARKRRERIDREEAERRAAAEEAERKQLADTADVARWTDAYARDPKVREQHATVDDYIAAMRAERDKPSLV